ncbi:MAG: tetratricopeptide repeat protein [Desulfatibacillaceae bacterium]
MAAILLATLAVAAYLRTVGFGFVNLDDLAYVDLVASMPESWPDRIALAFSRFHLTSYYPTRLVSYLLDYALWKGDPTGWHATNVALHAACTVLLYLVVLRAARTTGLAAPGLAAVCAGVLFAVHPASVEAVAWIPGREELLALLFTLAALLAWPARDSARGRLLALLFFLLAATSHVAAAVFPAVLVVWETAVRGRRDPPGILGRTWAFWLVGAAAVGLKLLGLLALDETGEAMAYPTVAGALVHLPELLEKNPFRYSAPLGETSRVATVLAVLAGNAARLILPVQSPASFGVDPVDGAPGLLVASGVACALALAAALFALRRRPLAFFGMTWCVLALLPGLQIVPGTYLFADRYLYPVLAGLCTVLGAAAALAAARTGPLRPKILVGLVACLFLVLIQVHADVFRSGPALHESRVRAAPSDPLARYRFALELLRSGNAVEARKQLRMLEGMVSGKEYRQRLFSTYLRMRQYDDATRLMRSAVAKEPENPLARNNLGLVLMESGRWSEAVRQLEKAVSLAPENAPARANLARAYSGTGRRDQADEQFEKALDLDNRDPAIHYNYARHLLRTNRDDKAGTHFAAARAIDPRFSSVIPSRRR